MEKIFAMIFALAITTCGSAQMKDTILARATPPLKISKADDKAITIKIPCSGKRKEGLGPIEWLVASRPLVGLLVDRATLLFSSSGSGITFQCRAPGVNIIKIQEYDETPKSVQAQIEIYPNPIQPSSLVHFKTPASDKIIRVEVLTASGQHIATQKFPTAPNGVQSLNLPKLLPGIYFISIKTEKSREPLCSKLMIQ